MEESISRIKKIFNRTALNILCASFVISFFAYIPAYAAASTHVRIPTLTFSDDCGVDHKKTSQEARGSMTDIIESELIDSFLPYEKKYTPLSPVCEFELPKNLVYTTSTQVDIVIRHRKTEYRPRIFFWNEEKKTWNSVETVINRKTHTARTGLKMRKGIVGVFIDTNDSYEGIGSWYAHKRYPSGSATNLFPLGTKLKVTNLENKKSAIVTVTSTWTNKDKKRVIDLVSTAFKKIALLGKGLIRVRIEKIKDVP